MLEVWLVTILLLLFFAAVIYFWAKVFIIDIVKTVEENRNSKFTKAQWCLIWLVALCLIGIVFYLAFRFDILI